MFHLWYVNLAVLLIAVPLRVILKAILAGLIIILYGGMFFYFSDHDGYINAPQITLNLLGLSNIFGTLLVLGIPMGMYSKFLVEEREISEKLLHNIMPKQIAELLKNSTEPVALENPDISVMMADIVNFTSFSDQVSAEKVVSLLNNMFSRFDDVVSEHNVEKIKTIGDAYMVVAGLPEPRTDHAQVLVKMSAKLIEIANEYNDHEGNPIQLRIGIHSGPAVSGVIGKSKFAFDVWGDTINTAARLESNGEPGRIHLSQKTFDQLQSDLVSGAESQSVDIKGKGIMKTFLI
jgi:class 3 adenylate cyclase